MKDYAKVGGKEGKPGYRVSVAIRNRVQMQTAKVKAVVQWMWARTRWERRRKKP